LYNANIKIRFEEGFQTSIPTLHTSVNSDERSLSVMKIDRQLIDHQHSFLDTK
jgi:hypothetical protein